MKTYTLYYILHDSDDNYNLEIIKQRSGQESDQADVRGRSEELSVWAGELDTLLLCLEDKWLPDLRPSSKEGTGDGLSGTRS